MKNKKEEKVKNNEFEVLEKGTKLLLLNRLNADFEQINKHEERFNGWVGRKCELQNDIYITNYSNVQKLEKDIALNMKLKFSNTEGIITSNISLVEKIGYVIRVITRNTIYEFQIL